MKIVVIAATELEIKPSLPVLKQMPEVVVYNTGIGMLNTAVGLSLIIANEKPNFIYQLGIAGCFNKEIPLASLFYVKTEMLGDLGVEEKGQWVDVFDMGLIKSNQHPFIKKQLANKLLSKAKSNSSVHIAKAITVNQITTQKKRVEALQHKYSPVLESMEGAALHYVCNHSQIPYLQIRSSSNYVGERNKSKWKLQQAIQNANAELIRLLQNNYHAQCLNLTFN